MTDTTAMYPIFQMPLEFHNISPSFCQYWGIPISMSILNYVFQAVIPIFAMSFIFQRIFIDTYRVSIFYRYDTYCTDENQRYAALPVLGLIPPGSD